MKLKIAIIFFGLILFVACNKADKNEQTPISTPTVQEIETITVEKVQSLCNTDLTWLKDIIKKADEDKATLKYNGQFIGSIWLYTYKLEPAILVQMMMGSGALAGYVFLCSGTKASMPETEAPAWFQEARTKGKLIYKNGY